MADTIPRHPIRVVSRRTGIAVDTLRVWERRYAVVRPVRNDRGRLYSDGDIHRLQLLAAAVSEGYGIGRVAQLADDDLQRLSGPPDPARSEVHIERRTGDDSDRILRALRAYDAARIERELYQLSRSMTPRAFVCGVMRPLLTRIGDEWQSGRITVAQEHLLSASLRSVLGHTSRRSTGASGPRLLFATPSGERHEFGILGAAILAAGAGCSVIYLGSDLPAADIIDAAIRSRAHTVVLGLIYEEAMRTALADVRRIADRLSDTAKVCVGGAQAAAASRAMKSACATLLPDFEAFEAHLAGLRTPA
jgi:DNA-binding transcriptional MerR regulator/methylmalonyl-CoA mutase cobalamin-binding subunit